MVCVRSVGRRNSVYNIRIKYKSRYWNRERRNTIIDVSEIIEEVKRKIEDETR
jgi:hypothetical protein